MSIGWIVSKVEGGGGPDWPPPPSSVRETVFSSRFLGLRILKGRIKLGPRFSYEDKHDSQKREFTRFLCKTL